MSVQAIDQLQGHTVGSKGIPANQHQLDPGRIMHTATAFWESKVLLTAVEFDLFSVLGEDSMTATELGEKLGIHPRGRDDFFDALVASEFLDRDGDGPNGKYRNTPSTAAFLDKALLCREGPIDLLLAELALHRLDLVVADRPIPAGLAVHGHSHRLGESPVGFFAAPGLIPDGVTFPACLDDAPLLLPGPGAAVRGQIERWLSQERLKPCIRGEFDNGALMKDFGQAGAGYFPAPISLAEEICARYGVRLVGAIERIRESFWLITVERRISHPAIRLLIESARDVLTTVRPASP